MWKSSRSSIAGPPGTTIIVPDLEGTGHMRATEEGATLETMIGPPSRTKLVLSNVEHGVTIGEFMMNDQLT